MSITVSGVKVIMDTKVSDEDIAEIITMSQNMLSAWFTGVTVISTIMDEMERFLTAHIIRTTVERQEKEVKIGDAEIKYMGYFGLNLDSTTYGQHLLAIDYTGTLANIRNKRAAGINAVSEDYSSQLDL